MVVKQTFQDKVSGVTDKRRGLNEALQYVRSGDTLVVWRLDRLGRTMHHLIQVVNDINENGISFHSLQENITMDRSNATGQLMLFRIADIGLPLFDLTYVIVLLDTII
jgi:DNA invertase Pin-like site-specific DNA recombinase